MATIRDVAKESGVSVTTVSFVLNNSPRPVSAETRRRVTEVARRMNYHPNAMARGLVQRKMNSLGVLFAQVESSIVTNKYATGILEGVFTEAVANGYDIHLYTRPWESAEVSAPRFRNKQTDGTMIIVPGIDSDMVTGLRQFGIPVVVVSSPTAIEGVSYVDIDNVQGARLAANHLLSLGHKRIAHVMGAPVQHSVFERRDAFLSSLEAAGIPMRREYLVGDSFVRDDVLRTARRLLSLPEPPTAIFASNDDIALHIVRLAQEMGINIPRDLSVIGFDDYLQAQHSTPPLTTIHHPLADIGRKATRLLLARIENEAMEDERCIFAPQLVVRGTTAPPPNT